MRRLYPFASVGLLFAGLVTLLASCSPAPNFWTEAKPGQKKVLVSFPPLYCIAHAVGGDDVYVLSTLTTQGVHDYEGTQVDIYKVNKADIYIYNGLTLDDGFSSNMLKNHRNKNLVEFNVGNELDKLDRALVKEKKFLRRNVKILHNDHFHEGDPHVWLSPIIAKDMTDIVATKLGELDPAKAKAYEKRAAAYKKELDDLLDHGHKAFASKKNKKFVTMHDSLWYFARAWNLASNPEEPRAIQTKPGLDPDGPEIRTIRNYMVEENVRVIAIEPQYPTRMAEIVRDSVKKDGIDVQIITLDPLETAPAANGVNPDPKFYIDKMRENIDTLAKALP